MLDTVGDWCNLFYAHRDECSIIVHCSLRWKFNRWMLTAKTVSGHIKFAIVVSGIATYREICHQSTYLNSYRMTCYYDRTQQYCPLYTYFPSLWPTACYLRFLMCCHVYKQKRPHCSNIKLMIASYYTRLRRQSIIDRTMADDIYHRFSRIVSPQI